MGGMNLHSIVPDASSDSRMWVGISAAGVFRTEDGGESWQPMNKGVRADFMGVPFPEIGQCPHRMVSPNDGSQTLYQQNHCGVYRSDNGGNDWIDISDGLPSRFGLAATEHPSDPRYVLRIAGRQSCGRRPRWWHPIRYRRENARLPKPRPRPDIGKL